MCTRPMYAVPDGYTEKGKVHYKWLGRDLSKLDRFYKYGNFDYRDFSINDEIIQIPCGTCEECRLQYSRQWSDRCMLELQYHKENWFLTLTYDDEHLHNCAKSEWSTLKFKDLQDFNKRLRKALSNIDKYDEKYGKYMFYACGEYGSTTFRPHYHMICYSLHLPDLEVLGKTELGDVLYKSEWLNEIWKNGFITIGKVSPSSTAYVARYVMKKAHRNNVDVLKARGMDPEFTTMSRRPAIGLKWYEEHKDSLYDYDYFSLKTDEKGVNVYMPRYFERKLDLDNPELLKEIKRKKSDRAAYKSSIKRSYTSVDEDRYNEIHEKIVNSRVQQLKRGI